MDMLVVASGGAGAAGGSMLLRGRRAGGGRRRRSTRPGEAAARRGERACWPAVYVIVACFDQTTDRLFCLAWEAHAAHDAGYSAASRARMIEAQQWHALPLPIDSTIDEIHQRAGWVTFGAGDCASNRGWTSRERRILTALPLYGMDYNDLFLWLPLLHWLFSNTAAHHARFSHPRA